MSWIGTPYRHQGWRKGVGCDCLGLVRGVWHEIFGYPIEISAPYTPDWMDSAGGDQLLEGADRYFRRKDISDMAAGDLVLFRWRPHLPARHVGITIGGDRFVHAYEGAAAVTASPLVPQWRRRLAAVFAFPDP
jgi:NlpC/P60 family putative phage cell wall peptidase